MDAISLHSLHNRDVAGQIVVKCKLHHRCKRITFVPSCFSFALLRSKIDQSFSLSGSAYNVKYRDDENEVTDICSDTDLWEAVEYFIQGTDDSSCSSSVVSFTSDGLAKVLLHVFIDLEYDGPSLSETMSYRSTHESARYGSQSSLPYCVKSDYDAASLNDASRIARRNPEFQFFTPDNLSIICGLLASIQAPILYSVLPQEFGSPLGIRLIHTLLTWSILLHLFGAIIAAISLLSGRRHQRVSFELPYYVHAESSLFRRVLRMTSDRVMKWISQSAQIFTILGIVCLLSAIMVLLWSEHALTLHVIGVRSSLMFMTWIFLAALVYHLTRTSNS